MRIQRHLPLTIALSIVAAAVATVEPNARPAAAGGGGCHGAPQTEGTGSEITMVHGCFVPTVLRTEPGTTITFENSDDWLHIVNGQTWNLPGEFKKGTAMSLTFDHEGTYPYACAYHPGMVGVVIVGDGVLDSALTGAEASSGVRYSGPSDPGDAPDAMTVPTPSESGGGGPSTAHWSAAALVTAAISAGAGGLWAGRRFRRT